MIFNIYYKIYYYKTIHVCWFLFLYQGDRNKLIEYYIRGSQFTKDKKHYNIKFHEFILFQKLKYFCSICHSLYLDWFLCIYEKFKRTKIYFCNQRNFNLYKYSQYSL